MKLKVPQYEKSIDLASGTITCLNCFTPNTMSSLVNSIQLGFDGRTEDVFFSEELKSYPLSKFSDIIYSPYLIDLNSKKIQTGLLNKIKGIFKVELEKLAEVEQIYKSLKTQFEDLISEIDMDLEYEDTIEAASMVKLFGLKIFDEDLSLEEKVIKYINLGSELGLFKYLFCLNFKSYFDNDEIQKIEEAALQCDIHLILVDCYTKPTYAVNEKHYAIDEPLDTCDDNNELDNIQLEYVFD